MSRMQITALTKLVDSAEGGRYTLPDDLLDAYRVFNRAKACTVPEVKPYDVDTAAARVVSALAGGTQPDLLEVGRQVTQNQADRQAWEKATHVLRTATEQAGNVATNLCSDLTEQIITKHLRPALDEVHGEAREVAAALTGYGPNPHRLITAPVKVRNAYARLPMLVARKDAILAAHQLVNAIGFRQVEHDRNGHFSAFADPGALLPGWEYASSAPMPRLPYPDDRAERLLWTVSDEVAKAQPWLPTVAEQDQAWAKHYAAVLARNPRTRGLVVNGVA